MNLSAFDQYTIFLNDFTADVMIAGEDGRRRARFHVELTVAHPGPGFPDDIAAVMSYEEIVLGLRALCAGGARPGPEDFAEAAAALCLESPPVARVRVELRLDDADGRPTAPPTSASILRARPAKG